MFMRNKLGIYTLQYSFAYPSNNYIDLNNLQATTTHSFPMLITRVCLNDLFENVFD